MRYVARAVSLSAVLVLAACQDGEVSTLTDAQRKAIDESVVAALEWTSHRGYDDKACVDAYVIVGKVQMKVGDVDEAYETFQRARDAVVRVTHDGYDRQKVFQKVSAVQARAGDVDGARATAALNRDTNSVYKEGVYLTVAEVQAEAGDVAGALETAALMGEYPKSQIYLHIARGQAKAGDIAGAKKTAANTATH